MDDVRARAGRGETSAGESKHKLSALASASKLCAVGHARQRQRPARGMSLSSLVLYSVRYPFIYEKQKASRQTNTSPALFPPPHSSTQASARRELAAPAAAGRASTGGRARTRPRTIGSHPTLIIPVLRRLERASAAHLHAPLGRAAPGAAHGGHDQAGAVVGVRRVPRARPWIGVRARVRPRMRLRVRVGARLRVGASDRRPAG